MVKELEQSKNEKITVEKDVLSDEGKKHLSPKSPNDIKTCIKINNFSPKELNPPPKIKRFSSPIK